MMMYRLEELQELLTTALKYAEKHVDNEIVFAGRIQNLRLAIHRSIHELSHGKHLDALQTLEKALSNDDR